MPRHSDIVGADAVHPIAYYQSTDPGAVGAGKHWYDTSDPDAVTLKVRNTNNDGWVVLYSSLKAINLMFGSGRSALNAGVAGSWMMPSSGQWIGYELVAPWESGSVVLDLWRDTGANYPPTVADTITAAAKPTLSSARRSASSTLTGWTTTFVKGHHFILNIDSVSTLTGISLTLYYKKT